MDSGTEGVLTRLVTVDTKLTLVEELISAAVDNVTELCLLVESVWAVDEIDCASVDESSGETTDVDKLILVPDTSESVDTVRLMPAD